MVNDDVSVIQSKLDVARASRRARQLARLDMPAAWLPIVLDALAQLAQLGIAVDRASVEHGCLRICMPTRDERARSIETQAAIACARQSGVDELRLCVLVGCRQVGPEQVGRALARDRAMVEMLRASHELQPSRALAVVLAAADATQCSAGVPTVGKFLAGPG
jgi:hypothetical protein